MAIQWEYNLVERPFCEQLKAMGWQWLVGDVDVPELTERAGSREVLLKCRLAAAQKKTGGNHISIISRFLAAHATV